MDMPMKTLLLLRHAHALPGSNALNDFDRPLDAKGKAQAIALGDQLAALHALPDLVLCSPARRAQMTAQLIAERAGIPAPAIEIRKALYEASPITLINILQNLDQHNAEVWLIAHNPAVTNVSCFLAGQLLRNLAPCCGYKLHLRIDHWREISRGCAESFELISTPAGAQPV